MQEMFSMPCGVFLFKENLYCADVISKHVCIYYGKSKQERVIHRFFDHLRPGGYLFVGHSESLAGLKIAVAPAASAVYRKPL